MERNANPSRGGRAGGNGRPSPRTAAADALPEGGPESAIAAGTAVVAAAAPGLAAASSLLRTIAGTERVACGTARIPQGRWQQIIASLADPGSEQPCTAGTAAVSAA